MSSVTFTGVTKRYGPVTAVDDLSLTVADGEFMVLLGPSGCGKSTALRMIAGLEEVTAGELRIGDRVVNNVVAAKRDVSMVFQSYALYPHMSVAKNVESPLITRATWVTPTSGGAPVLRKLSTVERKERVDDAARMLGLEPYLARKPGELSGGQRQRVLVARALVQDARVLLLDEPLSGVDPASATQIDRVFAELRGEERTLLVSSHDVESARAFDFVLCLHGRQVAFGPPGEVLDRATLESTYGRELIVLDEAGPARAVTVQHHEHGHGHGDER
jgi:multiple sugar transport system ATP-binding protein